MDKTTTVSDSKSSAVSPLSIIVLLGLVGALSWLAFRPQKMTEDYQEVKGIVASTTAVTTQGGNEFTVKVWLENQADIAYKVAAKVSGKALGQIPLSVGHHVTMQALTAEIEKPFTGLLHNVSPTIEVASLEVEDKPLTTWQDHVNYQNEQQKAFRWMLGGAIAFFTFVYFIKKRKQDQA